MCEGKGEVGGGGGGVGGGGWCGGGGGGGGGGGCECVCACVRACVRACELTYICVYLICLTFLQALWASLRLCALNDHCYCYYVTTSDIHQHFSSAAVLDMLESRGGGD